MKPVKVYGECPLSNCPFAIQPDSRHINVPPLSSDGRGESQASSSRSDSRNAAGEKESVWRRLSAET